MTMTPMCVANISNTKDGLVIHVRLYLDDGAISSETKPLVVSSSATAGARISSTPFRLAGTAISSLQSGLPSKLQACLTIADFQKHFLKAYRSFIEEEKVIPLLSMHHNACGSWNLLGAFVKVGMFVAGECQVPTLPCKPRMRVSC